MEVDPEMEYARAVRNALPEAAVGKGGGGGERLFTIGAREGWLHGAAPCGVHYTRSRCIGPLQLPSHANVAVAYLLLYC